jgi:uncharacterized protein YyaL (SSP411 family)
MRFPRTAALAAALTLLHAPASGRSGAGGPAPGEAPSAAPGAQAARVPWRPFGPEAFREAAGSGRLVLLYISAAWDYHDRVMSEVTYTDPGVVEAILAAYVPVRADTDHRPDLFMRYGMGSWPTTAVLLPDGHPLHVIDKEGRARRAGGAFFPPEVLSAYLRQLAAHHADNREMVTRISRDTDEAVLAHRNAARAEVTADLVEAVVGKIMDVYRGRPAAAERIDRHPDFDIAGLLLDHWHRKAERRVLDVGLSYLTDMGRGGVYDRLGGGFFRYAHDTLFIVPAFEKLPATNAAAIRAYLAAYQTTGNGVFLKFVEGSLGHVLRRGMDPGGRFFLGPMAAWTAAGDNGDFYTWTLDEAAAVLTGEELKVAAAAYDLEPEGEMRDTAPKRNVIVMAAGPKMLAERFGMEEARAEALLESARAKLFEAREKRPAPPVDPVSYADASGMMISAFLEAGRVLHRPDLTSKALEALGILLGRCRLEDGFVAHVCRPDLGSRGAEAFLGDQVHVAAALLDAHEEDGSRSRLEEARALADRALSAFKEPFTGGFTDRIPDPNAPGLLAWPVRDLGDGMAFTTVLLRLHHLTGEASYRAAARKAIESWADEAGALGENGASLGRAALRLIQPPLEILLAGDAADPELARGRARVLALHHPWRIVRHLTGKDGEAEMLRRGLRPASGAQVAFCVEKDCAGPYPAAEPLRARLDAFLNRGASQEKAGAPREGGGRGGDGGGS